VKPAVRIPPYAAVLFAGLSIAGAANGVLWFDAPAESGGARGVQGAVEELFSADNLNDIDRLASCFEEDGVWLPPTGEVVTGRRAISAWYRARHVRWTPALAPAVLDVRVDRASAVVHGAARGSLVPACGGAAVAVDDRVGLILTRDPQKTWKVTRLLWRRGATAG
jgi:uncharacterized protein (TIGR02246 family)